MSVRRALLLAAVAAAIAGCGARQEETRFLSFDAESTPREALVSGWSGFESGPSGDTFVWAQGRRAAVEVHATRVRSRLLRVRCWPFRWDGAPPQTVTVTLNGTRLETVGLSDGPRVYAVATPAEAWRSGKNILSFDFAYAEAPMDRVPGAGDARTLAAAFDWLEIVPNPE